MAPTATSLELETMSSNLGGILIGLVVSTMLFGMAIMQAYVYFTNFLGQRETRDKSLLRYTVVAICVLNAIVSVINIDMVYYLVTASVKGVNIVTKPTWNFQVNGILKTVLIWLVQSVYLTRIYILLRERTRLQRSFLLIGYLSAIAVLSLVAGILFIIGSVWEMRTGTLQSITSSMPRYVIGLSETVTALVDTIIAVFLAAVLRSSRTGIARTDRVLVRLYIYFHTSGILISFISILEAIFFLGLMNNLAFLATDFIINQVYTVSLLLLLNTRPSLREEMHGGKMPINLSNSSAPSTIGRFIVRQNESVSTDADLEIAGKQEMV